GCTCRSICPTSSPASPTRIAWWLELTRCSRARRAFEPPVSSAKTGACRQGSLYSGISDEPGTVLDCVGAWVAELTLGSGLSILKSRANFEHVRSPCKACSDAQAPVAQLDRAMAYGA